MRCILIIAVVLVGCFASTVSHAESKIFWNLMWPQQLPWNDWSEQDHKPYIEQSRWHHRYQSHEEQWTPQSWIERTPGGEERIVNNLKYADVISNFERNDDNTFFKNCPPILKVGQGFYRLSPMDKHRVMQFADLHYAMTSDVQNSSISIRDKYTKDEIGLYSKGGLQLH